MLRPSQSIYLCIVTRIGRFSAENRLVPDHIHLCRFPLYSYRETGYKSKKQRRDFPRFVAAPEARPVGESGEGGKCRGTKREDAVKVSNEFQPITAHRPRARRLAAALAWSSAGENGKASCRDRVCKYG